VQFVPRQTQGGAACVRTSHRMKRHGRTKTALAPSGCIPERLRQRTVALQLFTR
jgi:hypothetical protein